MKKDGPWKIVLVDDEEDIRLVTGISLEDSGFEVVTAADGASGLAACRTEAPQIVLTDIRMPNMGGIELLRRIKDELPDVEVIVMTAFGEMDLAVQALRLDASDFINKPIDDEALHLALKRAKERFTTRSRLKEYTRLLEAENAETGRELMKNIAYQRRLIDSSMDGILGGDENGTVVAFNNAMETMLGYKRHEIAGRMNWRSFFAPGQAEKCEKALESDHYGGKSRLVFFETSLLTREGKETPVQASAFEMPGTDNKGLVFFFRDLREIRRLEREMADQARILHQDKMMSLGRLAASVVHEINNPLAGVLNYARLMKKQLEKGGFDEAKQEKFKSYLDLIESETDRCSRIISNLLTFSRKSPQSFSDVSMDDLIHRCILMSKHKLDLTRIELHVKPERNIPPVKGDFNQLQQCLINLIFNAIDAMPDGGGLYIRTNYNTDERTVSVSVADTGPGVEPDMMQAIFEPFFTTKKEGYGVGLGLSTAYGIIERHRGSLTAVNRPQGGAEFVITLPAA